MEIIPDPTLSDVSKGSIQITSNNCKIISNVMCEKVKTIGNIYLENIRDYLLNEDDQVTDKIYDCILSLSKFLIRPILV